jgi:DNA polymerase I
VTRIPESSWFDPVVGATLHTGRETVGRVIVDLLQHHAPGSIPMSADIETPGLVHHGFRINCLTVAWDVGAGIQCVLLDPDDRPCIESCWELASTIAWHNCFTGDTRAITRDGVRTLADMAGEVVEVFTEQGWRKAPARCYGTARTHKIHVRPARYRSNVAHTFEATPNHRWPLVDGSVVTTDELRPGDLIAAVRVEPRIDYDSDAFKHGLIFADGTLQSYQPKKNPGWTYQLRLCGDKARWADKFDNVTYPPSYNGDPYVTGWLPFNPKELPVDPDAQYVADFVEGWQLMDGSDFGAGREMSCKDPEPLDWLMEHAATAGWYATGRNSNTSSGGYKPGSTQHRVILSRGEGTKPMQWRVTEIDPLGELVPVYCVEVPGIERFTLAEGIYTGNSPFDIPILWHAGLADRDVIAKSVDTLLLARMCEPDAFLGKSLEACAARHLGLAELSGGMLRAFHAAGYANKDDGYAHMTVDSPIYRLGAMCDTVVTLRLEPVLRERCRRWLTEHPFVTCGATTTAAADEIIATQETVNRVMLRRSAVGLAVDRDYLMTYAEQVDIERQQAEATLAAVGLQGGSGKAAGLMAYLDARGELPTDHPRTPKTGNPRATKDDLDELDHPLATAQRTLAATDKVLGYLEKVSAQAKVTGRCHPQANVLGASATGRTSYSLPELQQFPAAARPVIIDDGQGLTSIDWSSIEPVTMALLAHDDAFLAPFERGEDLYAPLALATGQPRDVNKTVLLAAMYGQGIPGLARRIKHTKESAAQIQRQIFAAMPACEAWMGKIEVIATQYHRVLTAGGRILSVPTINGRLAVHAAVNYSVQGSAYDLLAHTVCEMERQGIGDHLQLTLHDEVVVDTEVAEIVEKIMATAPAFLEKHAGRSIVLRTDRADLEHQWRKV